MRDFLLSNMENFLSLLSNIIFSSQSLIEKIQLYKQLQILPYKNKSLLQNLKPNRNTLDINPNPHSFHSDRSCQAIPLLV